MNAVNMMDQHPPEIQIYLEERKSRDQKTGPRNTVRATARVEVLATLRQKVTSKLAAESSCLVTTPAILQTPEQGSKNHQRYSSQM